MKKLVLLSFTVLAIVSLSACANHQSAKTESSNLKTVKSADSKYDSIISELKSELSYVSDYEWDDKITHNVTNADISKGVMIEIFPKEESYSTNLQDISTSNPLSTKRSKDKVLVLQKLVSKIAKKLPNDNSEITLGFQSEQKSKGVVPVARSVKAMDAIPIND